MSSDSYAIAMKETYGLLAMLYYKYWCKSDSERKYYLSLLAKI